MAKNRIKGITIEVGLDTVDLQKSLKDLDSSLKTTQDDLKDVNKLLKLDPSNVELLRQKSELLNKAVEGTDERLQKLRDALKKLQSSPNADKTVDQQNALQREIIETEQKYRALRKEQDDFNLSAGRTATSTRDVAHAMNDAGNSALSFGDILKANVVSDFVIGSLKTMAGIVKEFAQELNVWADSYRELEVYEKQFENNIRNTADATDDEIKELKKLAKAKEKQGVISQRAIMSGYQELATYVESTDAIEGLTEALADMSAQQYGVDATEESVRNIATTLGKALANGDYSGLTRLGYGFDEAQKKIMKYGSELERVEVLNEVIESSIGGMNMALAQTDAGKLFQVKSYFDEIKEAVGETVSQFEIGFIENVMPVLQPFIESLMTWLDENKDAIYETIVSIIEYLTSDEMVQFFSDVGQLMLDIGAIMEYVLTIGEAIGLWEGIFNAVKGVVEGIKELFDAIVSDIEYISSYGIGAWGMKNYSSTDWGMGGDSWTPGWSGGYGALNSGGFRSGGITLNASFNVNANNVTRRDVEQWSSWLVDSINTQLGEAI